MQKINWNEMYLRERNGKEMNRIKLGNIVWMFFNKGMESKLHYLGVTQREMNTIIL